MVEGCRELEKGRIALEHASSDRLPHARGAADAAMPPPPSHRRHAARGGHAPHHRAVRLSSQSSSRVVSRRTACIACAVAGLSIHDIDRTTHHWSWSCPPNLLSPRQWGKLAGQPTPADSDTNVASGAEHYDSIVYIDAPSDKSLSHACPTCALIKPYLTRRIGHVQHHLVWDTA